MWDLALLARFALARRVGAAPPVPFAAALSAQVLLRAGTKLDALPDSGCDELHVDFGSLGPPDSERAAVLAELVARLRTRGLRVHGLFTLGRDHDDAGCFERLVEWVERQRLTTAHLRLWTPEPGGAEVRELARCDRIRHLDLARWDGAHVVVQPAQMSAETLYRGWVWAQRRLGSLRSIWRRRPRRWLQVPEHLLAVALARFAPLRIRARLLSPDRALALCPRAPQPAASR